MTLINRAEGSDRWAKGAHAMEANKAYDKKGIFFMLTENTTCCLSYICERFKWIDTGYNLWKTSWPVFRTRRKYKHMTIFTCPQASLFRKANAFQLVWYERERVRASLNVIRLAYVTEMHWPRTD